MALSGKIQLASAAYSGNTWNFYFNWERTSSDVENNASILSWTLTCETTDVGSEVRPPQRLSIGSSNTSVSLQNYDITDYVTITAKTTVMLTGETTIPHDSTGAQGFRVRLRNTSGTGYVDNSESFAVAITYSGYQTGTIDYIVRKASIKSISATSITDEDTFSFTYSNPAGEYATLLQAGMSLTTTDSNMAIPYRNISKLGTSYTFSLTSTEKSNLYKVLDNKVTTANLRLFLKSTVPVLNGASTETVTEYRDISLTFVNFKPTLNVTLVDTNQRSLAVTGNNQIFVRGISDVQFNLGAQVYKGASYKLYYIQNGDNLLNQTSGYLTEVTSDTFYAYVEDNRGYFAAEEIVMPTGRWVDYFPLTCKIKSALLDANGTCAVTITGKYFQGTFGAVSNRMRMEYNITDESTSQVVYSDVKNISPSVDSQGNYSYDFTIPNLNYLGRYSLRVLAIDEVMTNYSQASTIIGAIPVFDWGKEDFAFYVPVSINEARVPAIVQQGTSGIWTYRKWDDGVAECWGTLSVTTSLNNSSNASWYSSGELSATNITYPFTFTSRPSVTATVNPNGSTWAILFPSNTAGDASKTGSYQLNSMSSFTSKTYLISYQVRGRWK